MNELKHYGIPGQKRGIRRYQNEDGTLTEEGKIRYGYTGRYKTKGARKKELASAIKSSHASGREKAKVLEKAGLYSDAADQYQKNYLKKVNAVKTINRAYPLAALGATAVLGDRVSKGKMTTDQAVKVGVYSAVGKQVVNKLLLASASNDANKFRKNYWKFD